MSIDEGVLLADGWEEEFLGTASVMTRSGLIRVAVYDVEKITAKLMNQAVAACGCQGMGECESDHYLEAVEYVEFNILGAFTQDGMPVYLTPRNYGEWMKEMEELS